MYIKKLYIPILASAFLLFMAAGCDTIGSGDKQGEGTVKLQLKTVNSSSAKSASSGNRTLDHDSLSVSGSNGTLQIDDVRFIVEKFKLEPADTDEEADSLDTEVEEFESEPFFVDLPLTEDTLSLATDQIQAGFYEELEFEVKDLDFDDGDEEDDDAEHQALADSIRAEFPDWPDEASMIIVGTFTPTDGSPQAFKVFAEAEIEIEREFNPPLEVTESNMQDVLSVRIDPSQWLLLDDGTVIDLSAWNWDDHQELLEFEAKFKEGVQEIEVDEIEIDDEEDDEDDEDDNEDDS